MHQRKLFYHMFDLGAANDFWQVIILETQMLSATHTKISAIVHEALNSGVPANEIFDALRRVVYDVSLIADKTASSSEEAQDDEFENMPV
jgi:hypothetical protein